MRIIRNCKKCNKAFEILLSQAGGNRGSYCSVRCKAKNAPVTHGKSKTRLYRLWGSMKSRCIGIPLYAGRGIKVCEDWSNDFMSFYNWAIENGYQDHLTIDRYPNNDGNYEPSNCRWATHQEQNLNKRDSLSHETKECCKMFLKNTEFNMNDIGRMLNISPGSVWHIKNDLVKTDGFVYVCNKYHFKERKKREYKLEIDPKWFSIFQKAYMEQNIGYVCTWWIKKYEPNVKTKTVKYYFDKLVRMGQLKKESTIRAIKYYPNITT